METYQSPLEYTDPALEMVANEMNTLKQRFESLPNPSQTLMDEFQDLNKLYRETFSGLRMPQSMVGENNFDNLHKKIKELQNKLTHEIY